MNEMVTYLPISSPFIRFAGRYVDEAFGGMCNFLAVFPNAQDHFGNYCMSSESSEEALVVLVSDLCSWKY